MSFVTVEFPDINTPEGRYLDSSARIRKTSRSQLIKKVLEIVLNDQLILSILDDAEVEVSGRHYRAPHRKVEA